MTIFIRSSKAVLKVDTTGKPEADTPVVRIFCDYAAEGVWGYPLPMLYEDELYTNLVTDKEADLEALLSLGRSEDFQERGKDWQLLRELEQWNEQYDRWYLDWEQSLDGDSPAPDMHNFDPDAFTEAGKQLAFRMKQHHPVWIVSFLDEVASDRASHSTNNPTCRAGTFTYIVEIGHHGEMILVPCVWEWINGRCFPRRLA